jgi:transcription elongation factor Elf1
MPAFQSLDRESKSLCAAHVCPRCGTRDQVTAERVIEGTTSITRCHCRACDYSWHPQVEDEVLS